MRGESAERWVTETWRSLAREGGGTRTTAPPIGQLVAYHGSYAAAWLGMIGLGISILHWLLSGMQVGAYKRMLKRHESGRCPDCNYDIAAHPDAVCPECGCDHRARRREAIDALRRARQWPPERPLPS